VTCIIGGSGGVRCALILLGAAKKKPLPGRKRFFFGGDTAVLLHESDVALLDGEVGVYIDIINRNATVVLVSVITNFVADVGFGDAPVIGNADVDFLTYETRPIVCPVPVGRECPA